MTTVQDQASSQSAKAKSPLSAAGRKGARAALRFATILVPIDYSPASRLAFESALDLAERFDARVCLLHVLEDRTSPDFDSFPLAARRDLAQTGARRKLVAFAKSGGHPFVPVFPDVLSGDPWKEILAAARKENADLIVIPTRGNTGLKHVLMGSVAEKVVRLAHCPVLVLRNDAVDFLAAKNPAEKTEEKL